MEKVRVKLPRFTFSKLCSHETVMRWVDDAELAANSVMRKLQGIHHAVYRFYSEEKELPAPIYTELLRSLVRVGRALGEAESALAEWKDLEKTVEMMTTPLDQQRRRFMLRTRVLWAVHTGAVHYYGWSRSIAKRLGINHKSVERAVEDIETPFYVDRVTGNLALTVDAFRLLLTGF